MLLVHAGGFDNSHVFHRARNAATPTIAVTTEERIIGGTPKYRKLSTTPTTCAAKKTQPSAPIAAGFERANCPRCQHRKADRINDTVQDNPNPR